VRSALGIEHSALSIELNPVTSPKPPSGRTIVLELLKEMEERRYPLFYRTLPPAAYHVYLHPDDFRTVEPIVPAIVADAQQGLTARVDALNGRSRLSRLISGTEPPLEIPPAGWEIHVRADANGELGRGEIGIESRLSIPPPPRYEGGAATTRIAKTIVTGSVRRSLPPEAVVPAAVASELFALVPEAAVAAAGVAGDATATASRVPPPLPAALVPRPGMARLAYADEDGPHVFVMHKDVISIGRGGSAHWVDVQVATTAKVSREHCRIRRAPDGRYYLEDVSTWGTSVDGQAVTPFSAAAETAAERAGQGHELPARARIQLADAVVIDFSVDA
jgi:hypothetical protein